MPQVRVVSYNVRSLRDDQDALARVIRDLDPDVLCVQEAPKYFLWRNKCASFARRLDLLYVGGGRPAGGAAMLTPVRVDVRAASERRLSKTPWLARRGLVLADLAKGGARLRVGSIHLGLDASERARHLTEITGMLGSRDDTVTVLAGDFNETSGAPTWERLAQDFVDAGAGDKAYTFSAQKPRRRIDGVFVRGPAKVASYQVIATPDVEIASDHRPVVVDLEI